MSCSTFVKFTTETDVLVCTFAQSHQVGSMQLFLKEKMGQLIWFYLNVKPRCQGYLLDIKDLSLMSNMQEIGIFERKLWEKLL